MSTRSGIAVEHEDDTVVGVYSHSDGYPAGVGKILHEHYHDREKALALVALGNISCLAAEIGERHPFRDRLNGWTTFYGRDRGESDVGPTTAIDRESWRHTIRQSGVEYLYLLTLSGEWLAAKPYGRWRDLSQVLKRGVDVLVEPDPDRGADIVIARGSPLLNIGYIRGITAAGRIWLDEHVREDVPVVSGSIVAEAIIAERLIDGARRDGLVVEEEDDS